MYRPRNLFLYCFGKKIYLFVSKESMAWIFLLILTGVLWVPFIVLRDWIISLEYLINLMLLCVHCQISVRTKNYRNSYRWLILLSVENLLILLWLSKWQNINFVPNTIETTFRLLSRGSLITIWNSWQKNTAGARMPESSWLIRKEKTNYSLITQVTIV